MTGRRTPGAAVVGTGFIGVVHVEALRRLGVEVVGVVGSTPDRAREKARTYPLPEPYESFDEMLADARVGVVHLTSPNNLHRRQAVAALEAGKHVVCEKPLALSSAETEELLRLAERSGLVHCTNFNMRFYPSVHQARALCRDGEVGEVRNVIGGYLQDWLLHQTDWNWRLEPGLGGELRVVGDIGSHWLDLTRFVTGLEPVEVLAELRTFVPIRGRPSVSVETYADAGDVAREPVEIRTEDVAHVLLRYESGAVGAMTVSQVSPGRKNRISFEVHGSRASLAWTGERAEELWIGRRDAPNELLLRDPGLFAASARSSTSMPGGLSQGYESTFRELYRRVYAAVADGAPPPEPDYPTFADGHRDLLIGDAIARSAREGRWVEVARAC